MLSCRRAISIYVLLGSAALLFAFGVFAPLMTVKKLLVFTTTVSLGTLVFQLFADGHYILGLIVGVFALIVPIGKMVLVFLACWHAVQPLARWHTILHWLALWGKWSMLDVFIVALLVVVGKMQGLVSVKGHYGLYAFAASIILLHLATCRLVAISTAKS